MENRSVSKVNKTIKFTPLNLKKEYDVNEKKDVAVLSWGIRNGYPRISVSLSNVRTEKPDYSKLITAPFDYVSFAEFLIKMKEVIYSKQEEVIRKVDCLNVRWKDGVKTNEIYVQATVNVGKGKDGIIFLAVIEDKKIKVKFDILPPEPTFHRWYDDQGNVIEDKGVLSKNRAISYVNILEKLMDDELKTDGKYIIEKTEGINTAMSNLVINNNSDNKELTPLKTEKADSSSDINIEDLF